MNFYHNAQLEIIENYINGQLERGTDSSIACSFVPVMANSIQRIINKSTGKNHELMLNLFCPNNLSGGYRTSAFINIDDFIKTNLYSF